MVADEKDRRKIAVKPKSADDYVGRPNTRQNKRHAQSRHNWAASVGYLI